MRSYPIPSNESSRLKAIEQTHALADAADPRLDSITQELARLFDMPTALVSIVDANRQYFRSRIGMEPCETSRDMSICAHVIMSTKSLVICDTQENPRFRNHPVVVNPPHVRFYAGTPIILSNGFRAGSLCLLDYIPREAPDPALMAHLEDCAREVAAILESEAQTATETNAWADQILRDAEEANLPVQDATAFASARTPRLRTAPEAKSGGPDVVSLLEPAERAHGAPSPAPSPPRTDRVSAEDPAELARREFLCLVGHELRTPLTVLTGYAKILERRITSDSDRAMTEAINRAGDHLLSVVENILAYSDLTSGERLLSEAHHPPRPLLEEIGALMRPNLKLANKTLTVAHDDRLPDILIDRNQMRLVLMSLMKNAAMHGGDRIVLSSRMEDEGVVRLTVYDSGTPIRDEAADLIFQPFENGTELKNRAADGIGLGLALARRIIDMHGGELTLERGDSGNAFVVRLPVWRC